VQDHADFLQFFCTYWQYRRNIDSMPNCTLARENAGKTRDCDAKTMPLKCRKISFES
jgi:hypothetical protein